MARKNFISLKHNFFYRIYRASREYTSIASFLNFSPSETYVFGRTSQQTKLAHQQRKKVSLRGSLNSLGRTFNSLAGLGPLFFLTSQAGKGGVRTTIENRWSAKQQERGRDASRGSQFVKLVTDAWNRCPGMRRAIFLFPSFLFLPSPRVSTPRQTKARNSRDDQTSREKKRERRTTPNEDTKGRQKLKAGDDEWNSPRDYANIANEYGNRGNKECKSYTWIFKLCWTPAWKTRDVYCCHNGTVKVCYDICSNYVTDCEKMFRVTIIGSWMIWTIGG